MKWEKKFKVFPPEKQLKKSCMNTETVSSNVRAMDEVMKAAAVPDKYNEEYFEAELLPGKTLMLLKICMQNQVLILK